MMARIRSFQLLLLDVLRAHANSGRLCRVTCIPPRCRMPRTVDCQVDSIGTAGRVNLRPLHSHGCLSVPVGRVQRVELLRAA